MLCVLYGVWRRYCEKEEYPFISMEWFGVGDSEGRFEHGTISR